MNQSLQKLSGLSAALLMVGGVALILSIFLPIWRIDLDAPQYPEGLQLLIYANKLGGQVDIVNGLNHYIGMRTLHREDFVEFKVLPYLIGLFALLCFLVAFLRSRKGLVALLISFALFGIVAMVDFYRWEYDYGHNLNPDAAIQIPGMSYQPPLIGFKQLLNFGAYSIPDIGGWLMVLAGIILLFSLAWELNWLKFKRNGGAAALALVGSLSLLSCTEIQPSPIRAHKDNCHHCQMMISDLKFATELITEKGRIHTFDDLNCMLAYRAEKPEAAKSRLYVADYFAPGILLPVEKAWFVHAESLRSPMGGNTAATADKSRALKLAGGQEKEVMTWSDLTR